MTALEAVACVGAGIAAAFLLNSLIDDWSMMRESKQGAEREVIGCPGCGCREWVHLVEVHRVKRSLYVNQLPSVKCNQCGARLAISYDADIINGTGQRSAAPPTRDGR